MRLVNSILTVKSLITVCLLVMASPAIGGDEDFPFLKCQTDEVRNLKSIEIRVDPETDDPYLTYITKSGIEYEVEFAWSDFEFTSRAIYAGAAGDVALVLADGATATFRGVPAGTVLPVAATRVLASGTTIAAANLLALL